MPTTSRTLSTLVAAVIVAGTACAESVGPDADSSDSRQHGATSEDRPGAPHGEENTHSSDNSNEATSEPSDPTDDSLFSGRDTVPAPWTHVLPAEWHERVELRDDRLHLPAAAEDFARDLERHDVVVSGALRNSFIRRVRSVERRDAADASRRWAVDTEPARLTDAVLEGSTSPTSKLRSWTRSSESGETSSTGGRTDGPMQTGRRRLRNGDIEYDDLGTFTLQDMGVSSEELQLPSGEFSAIGGTLDFDLTGRAALQLDTDYWFRLEIDFDSERVEPRSPYFFSTRTCNDKSDCFQGGAAGGEECHGYVAEEWPDLHDEIASKLEPYDPDDGNLTQYCVYDPASGDVPARDEQGRRIDVPEYRTCGRLLEVLDWVKTDEGRKCAEDWEVWYDSDGERGPRLPDTCERDGPDALAPYPAQIEWAKLVCDGSLTTFEFDVENDVRVGLEDFSLDARGAGAKAWPLFATGDKPLAGAAFAIGPVPVVITLNGSLTVPFAANVDTSFGLNRDDPGFVGVREAHVPGGGLHYYGSPTAYDTGHFGPPAGERPADYLGEIHANNVELDPDAELDLPSFQFDRLEGSATLAVVPELNLLLYQTTGPFLRPLSPYASVHGDADPAKTCHVGLEAGASGSLGLKAQIPFAPGPAADPAGDEQTDASEVDDESSALDFLETSFSADWTLYNTCGGSGSPFADFGYDQADRSELPVARGCPSGLDGLCYRRCLLGNCPSETADTGGAMTDAGGGSGTGTGGSDAGGADDASPGGIPSNASGNNPRPDEEQNKPALFGDVGCASSPRSLPASAWVLLLAALVAGGIRRRREITSERDRESA